MGQRRRRRKKPFTSWDTQRAWVLSYAQYLAPRTVILIQRKDPRDPTKNIFVGLDGPGNGSGTYIAKGRRTFIATAKHVALGFTPETGFYSVPALRPGLAMEMKCPIMAVHLHRTRDVALIEINPEVPRSMGYIPVPIEEVELDYREASRDPLMWAGYPKDLRSSEQNPVQDLGFHFAVTRPILRPERRRRPLEAAIDSEAPLDLNFDFFSLRLPDATDLETGKKGPIEFGMPGLSGGGLWKLPPRLARRELVNPTRMRLIGIQCSTVPMPGKTKEEWVRATRCKAIHEILGTLG